MPVPLQQHAEHAAQTAHYAECRRKKLLSDRLLKWSFLIIGGINYFIFLIGFLMLFLTLGILEWAYLYAIWYCPFQLVLITGAAYKKQLWCIPLLLIVAVIACGWYGQMPLAGLAASLNMTASLGASVACFLGIRIDRQLAEQEGYPQFLDILPTKEEQLPSTTELIRELNRRDRPDAIEGTPGAMQELCIPEDLSEFNHSQEEQS